MPYRIHTTTHTNKCAHVHIHKYTRVGYNKGLTVPWRRGLMTHQTLINENRIKVLIGGEDMQT